MTDISNNNSTKAVQPPYGGENTGMGPKPVPATNASSDLNLDQAQPPQAPVNVGLTHEDLIRYQEIATKISNFVKAVGIEKIPSGGVAVIFPDDDNLPQNIAELIRCVSLVGGGLLVQEDPAQDPDGLLDALCDRPEALSYPWTDRKIGFVESKSPINFDSELPFHDPLLTILAMQVLSVRREELQRAGIELPQEAACRFAPPTEGASKEHIVIVVLNEDGTVYFDGENEGDSRAAVKMP